MKRVRSKHLDILGISKKTSAKKNSDHSNKKINLQSHSSYLVYPFQLLYKYSNWANENILTNHVCTVLQGEICAKSLFAFLPFLADIVTTSSCVHTDTKLAIFKKLQSHHSNISLSIDQGKGVLFYHNCWEFTRTHKAFWDYYNNMFWDASSFSGKIVPTVLRTKAI